VAASTAAALAVRAAGQAWRAPVTLVTRLRLDAAPAAPAPPPARARQESVFARGLAW
jgi:hypothetical protein